jgi:drug/metabolite transporter (DMT)-like permease
MGVSLPGASPSNEVIWAVLTLALASTALAYILFFELISKAGTSNAMLVTLLVPVSGSILGHLVMGDQLHLVQLLGALMIGLGLLIIDGRLFKRIKAN